jgi:hypothetical protein
LDKFDRALPHITAWEFVALGVNIIVFGAALAGQRVVLLADALASVQVMVNRAAHSPVMQIIHRLILALPEVEPWEPIYWKNMSSANSTF